MVVLDLISVRSAPGHTLSPTKPSEAPFDDVKWENVVINGSELLINGKNGKALKSKDLRCICSRLKIRGVKNATTEIMVQRIIDMHSNREKYEMIRKEVLSDDMSTKARKEAIREMNNSKMQSEIVKRMLDLLENAEKRHKREEERKVKEEEQKAKEYEMHERKQTFDEWEKNI